MSLLMIVSSTECRSVILLVEILSPHFILNCPVCGQSAGWPAIDTVSYLLSSVQTRGFKALFIVICVVFIVFHLAPYALSTQGVPTLVVRHVV